MKHALTGLYGITADSEDTAAMLSTVAALLSGGMRLLQYRNKSASAALKKQQGRQLRELTRAHGALLIVNDSAELALALNADGLHIGRDDGPLSSARELLGPNAIIGVSCYDSLARAQAATLAGADYLAFGAMFASATKPAAVRAPLSLIAAARQHCKLPIACIGGITLDNAASLHAAGADMLAVIGDLFAAPDPAARATAYQQLLHSPRPTHD